MRRNNFFAAALLLFAACPASAYIPPSQYIVKTMAQKHAGVKGVKIRSTVLALDGDKPTGVRFRETVIYDSASRTLRSRAFDDSGKELFAQELRLSPEKAVSDFGALLSEVLLGSQSDSMIRALVQSGVQVRTDADLKTIETPEGRAAAEKTYLQRFKQTIAWVIGAHPRKAPHEPQLWVEKDTFLPLKLVVARGRGETLEAEFENYKMTKEFPYPRSIRVLRGAEPQFRVDLVEVALDPADLAALKKPLEAVAADSAGDGATRELVRKYYDLGR